MRHGRFQGLAVDCQVERTFGDRQRPGDGALQALGQKRESLRYWTKSLRSAPDNAALRAKLKENGVDPDELLLHGK